MSTPAKLMRLLVFGDVVGQPGRRALKALLPGWRTQYQVDAVIANVENLAHGKGITKKTLDELLAAGVDFCTSGNHIMFKEGNELLANPAVPVLRPANFSPNEPGRGNAVFTVGEHKLLLINLIGTAFFRESKVYANPFTVIDEILADAANANVHGIVVDWHAEATSEKIALGLYLDGRVSAVFGTHTHVTTADLRMLPNGTAYRTDLGMTGLRDEVLGVDHDIIIKNILHPDDTTAHQWSERGPAQVHGVLLEIDPNTRRAVSVSSIDHDLTV